MTFLKKSILIVVVLVSCVGCDQATKSIAVAVLPEAQAFSYLGDTVRLQLAHNRGAFLSMGASLPEAWRQGIFTMGTGFLLLCVLAFAFMPKPGHHPLVVLATALVVAGGTGNLVDRVAHHGSVVDFINIGIGPVRTGIFNIADVAITVGALIFLSTALHRPRKGR